MPPRRRTLERIYPCTICKSKFSKIPRFLNHVRIFHGLTGFQIMCPIRKCTYPKMMKCFSTLRQHLYRTHPQTMYEEKLSNNSDKLNEESTSETGDFDEQSESEENPIVTEGNGNAELENEPVDVLKKTALYILKKRELHLMPRTVVEEDIKDLRNLLSCTSTSPQNDFINSLEWLKSEFRLNAYCKDALNFNEPKTFTLGEELINGKVQKHSYQYISLIDTLREYMKLNEVLSSLTKNSEDSTEESPSSYESYCDGQHFRNSKFFAKHPNVYR